MIPSSFHILFVVSVIEAAPNSYLGSIPVLGEWISSSSNSKNELGEVGNKEVSNVKPQKVVDASKNDKGINVVANADEPIPVEDLLDQLNNELKINDDQHKAEIFEVSQQLETALYNNTIRKVNVLLKGIWHVVDLGLAGSSQRKRSAKKSDGMMDTILSGIEGVFCCVFTCQKDEEEQENLDTFPKRFDARQVWPVCKDLISSIRNQGHGHVGSCWAVATASMLSDRLCIASEGKYKMSLSAEDLMRCCESCALLENGVVVGGYMDNVMNFLTNSGIVSGGEYGSKQGCLPYSYPPYRHPDFESRGTKNGECEKKCSNENYSTPYNDDKYFIEGLKRYKLPEDSAAIKEDLRENGSCIALMREYDDFYWNYKKGIYTHTGERDNSDDLDHFIRLIGWGKENGVEYWLVANSRGKGWGEEGIGKINVNGGCDFGQSVWCVKPKVPT